MVSTSGGGALSKLTEGEAGPQAGWTILEASGASAWGVIIDGEESARFALHVLYRRCGVLGSGSLSCWFPAAEPIEQWVLHV